MSTVNKLPIIKKILDLMKSEEIIFIQKVMDTKDIKTSVSFGAMPDHHEICVASIQNENYQPISGILWNTRDEAGNQLVDNYYLIDLFKGDYVNFYHIVEDKFTRIKESITLLEIRYWLLDYVSSKGTVKLQYDDGTLGAPTDAKVRQFVIDNGFANEDQWWNLEVVIKSTKVIWTYVQVSAVPLRREWVGGGTDVVEPFTNTKQGSIIGDSHDGYVEHLATDSDGFGHVHGFENKINKIDAANIVYANDNAKNPTSVGYDINATSKTLAQRDVNGRLYVGAGTSNSHAVNLSQMNTELDKYLPLDGSKAMTGNLDMNNHIINMKGAKIGNLGAGGDDDAISKGKAKELFVNKKTASATDTKTYAYAFTKDGQTEVDVSSIGKVKDVQEKQSDGTYKSIVSDGIAKLDSIDKVNKKSTTDDKVYSYGYDKTDKEKGIEIVSDYTENSKSKIASAYQTNDLNTRIANVESIGRSLSGWNCRTGKASTAPTTLPYAYKTGDYYTVQVIDQDSDYPAYEATAVYTVGDKCKYDSKYYICKIATTGTFDPTKWDEHNITNYKPYGSEYSSTASTVVETGTVAVNDTYRYDGTNWILFHTTGNYLPAHDGVGTGTTKLENLIISGDTQLHDLQVVGDADFANPITIADAGGVDEAVSLGQLNKRILDLSTAPTTTTKGIKGQLAFARDTAKLYHCTSADDVASAYVWEEFSGGSVILDNKTIKTNASGQIETTIGGWKETSPEIRYADKSGVTAESGTTVELYKINSKKADFVENANVYVEIGYAGGSKTEKFTATAKTQPITIAGVEANYLAVKMPTADVYLAYVKFDGVVDTLCVVDKLGIGMTDPNDYITAYTPAVSTVHYVNNEYILVDGTTITVDATTGALKASGGSGAEIVTLNGNFTSASAEEFTGTLTADDFNKLKEGKALCLIKIPVAADVYFIVSVNTRIYDPTGTNPIISATAEYVDATNINNVYKYALRIDGNAKTFVGHKLSSSNFKYLRKDGAAVGSNDEFEGTLTDGELTELASAETLFELKLTDTSGKLWYVPVNTRVFDADRNVSGAVFKYDPTTKAQVKFAFTVAPNGGADTTFHLSKVSDGGTSIQFDKTIIQNASTGLYGTVIGGYDDPETIKKTYYVKDSMIIEGSTSATDGSYEIDKLEEEIKEGIGTLKVIYYNKTLGKELTWEDKPQYYNIEIGGVTGKYLAVKSSKYELYIAKVPFDGGTDPVWCLLDKTGGLLSVDVNKDYISAYTETTIPAVRHYVNNNYLKIGSGLEVGSLGELDIKTKQDDSSIIINDSNKYAVSYGGSYKETRIEVIKNYLLGDKIDDNLYKMTSAEATGVTELPKGIRIVGTVVYNGDEYDIDEVVQTAEFIGVDPSITYSGNRIMLVELDTDVYLYFGQLLDHPDTPFVFYCESGDITTYLVNLTSVKLSELVISSTNIKANVVPINEDFMKVESGGIMPLYDDEVSEFAKVAPTGDAVYNELNKINVKIPEEATASNKLVDEAAADQKIALVEARQLYKTNEQGSFATKAELLAATTFYRADGTEVTPNLNDIAYVLVDETRSNKTAKYTVASLSPVVWGFVIAFTDLQLTTAQQNALNSGITSAKVTQYNNYASNKVNKAGDTMTGDLIINKSNPILSLKDAANDYSDVRHVDKNNVMQACIRFRSDYIQFYKKAATGENWWNGPGIVFNKDGSAKIQSSTSDGATSYPLYFNNDGTMKTGMAMVHTTNDGHVIKSSEDTRSMWISGGTSINTGSSIRLSGNNNINKGSLTLLARSSSSVGSNVVLTPDGGFTHDGKDVCVQSQNTVELWSGEVTTGTVSLKYEHTNYSAVVIVCKCDDEITSSYFPAPVISSVFNELVVSLYTLTVLKYLVGSFTGSKNFKISKNSNMKLIGIYGIK